MTEPAMPRAERRRLKKLTIDNEPTIEGDARFFRRRRDRAYRVRKASSAEVEMLMLLHGYDRPPAGTCWYTAVRSFGPGVRMRAFMHNRTGLETDLNEDSCRVLYQEACGTGAAEREEVMRQIAENRL